MHFAESPWENNRPGRRGKQSCEIFFRRKAVGTSCSDDGIEHRAGFSSFYRRGEQPVLSSDRERTDRVLRPVVRDRDVPVLQEAVQIRLLVLCILYRRRKRRLRRRDNRFKPCEEIVKDGFRLLLTLFSSCFGIECLADLRPACNRSVFRVFGAESVVRRISGSS